MIVVGSPSSLLFSQFLRRPVQRGANVSPLLGFVCPGLRLPLLPLRAAAGSDKPLVFLLLAVAADSSHSQLCSLSPRPVQTGAVAVVPETCGSRTAAPRNERQRLGCDSWFLSVWDCFL